MERKANGHNAAYIKRQARKLQKLMNLPYHIALNQAAKEADFTNWQNFINSAPVPGIPNKKQEQLKPKLPIPLVISYRSFFAKSVSKRPNAKMPVKAHQEISQLLKEALAITDCHKRANTPLGEIRTTLDDWVQKEYPSHEELPEEVFHAMYYGDSPFECECNPPDVRKQDLRRILERIGKIIDANYHSCSPVRWIHKRLANTSEWIDKWPKQQISNHNVIPGRVKELLPGTLVRTKAGNNVALVINHDTWSNTISCYGDKGSMTCARHEVTVTRDQKGAKTFKPMRLFLPYGKWKCADGTEVLYNRDYCPLWARTPGGGVEALDPDTWVKYQGDSVSYFNNGDAPRWGSKDTLATGLAVLKEWGVDHKRPRLLDLLPHALETRNAEVLRPKNKAKGYPAIAM
ncbi:MAG TPA: DUF5623 domain-containing protein [Alphaproteobacteria bacterium]